MSAPIRFLAVAVVGWGVMRAVSLGALPGPGILTVQPSEAAVPPIIPTSFPPIEPAAPDVYADARYYAPAPPAPPAYAYYPQPYPYYAAASLPRPAPQAPIEAEPVAHPDLYAAGGPPDRDWLLGRFAGASVPARRSSAPVFAPAPKPKHFDRLQLTSWTLLRGQSNPSAIATGGTLGGSQAGARLTYNFNRRIAASLRSSAPLSGVRGGEVAAGVKITPFDSIPLSLTAERRQSIGRGGGRSAFALFLEGGVYHQPMPWRFRLDAYAQAGVVGMRHRDLFADGAFTLTRPVFGRFSAGLGMWGGIQPGLYRVDAGPRVSMKVRDNINVHLDYRQRIAGTASPPSGPALTLAGDF
jgi:hypothetical protein